MYTKIVITGGPCAGKTTAMSHIQTVFTEKGYIVLFVPETATELINGGIAPWIINSNSDFQEYLLRLQIQKEKIYEKAAMNLPNQKILIVCDRGAIDGKAYMTQKEFSDLLNKMSIDEVSLRDNYDAVFHLVTAAKGAKEYYTTQNNTARTETIEQAAIADDKIIAAWTGHPHFRIIDNSGDFNEKIKRLIKEISSFLGEPEPLEIERKFLIKYPDINWLSSLPNCQKNQIIQTYLKINDKEEIRIRQRGIDGHYTYTYTKKQKISNLKRIETEKRISEKEYLRYLMDADTSKKQIRKDRYCLTYDNQYFEIDIYPFWSDKAIMEIELSNENEPIHFPKEITIIKDVTNDNKYKNAQLASHS